MISILTPPESSEARWPDKLPLIAFRQGRSRPATKRESVGQEKGCHFEESRMPGRLGQPNRLAKGVDKDRLWLLGMPLLESRDRALVGAQEFVV